MESFLRAHVGAFAGLERGTESHFARHLAKCRAGAPPRRFNPTLLDCVGHYRYAPRPVAVPRGTEGRGSNEPCVTRTGGFFVSAQADVWGRGAAAERRRPDQDAIPVREAFVAEARHLLARQSISVIEQVAVSVGKTPSIIIVTRCHTASARPLLHSSAPMATARRRATKRSFTATPLFTHAGQLLGDLAARPRAAIEDPISWLRLNGVRAR
jgi:hypothetical protein